MTVTGEIAACDKRIEPYFQSASCQIGIAFRGLKSRISAQEATHDVAVKRDAF